jgi:hypothetical protein
MNGSRAFEIELPISVPAGAIYAVLSDIRTHLAWGGEQAPDQRFRLLTLETTGGPAGVGTMWESTGSNGPLGTFHDRSKVVIAEEDRAFGFDTEATLERKHAKTWTCHVEHRYTIRAKDGGSTLTYHFEVFPKNYRPFWLKAPFWPMTRASVSKGTRKTMENIARLASTRSGT